MSDALGATIVGDDVDIITDSLPVSDMVALAFSIASRFENGFVGTSSDLEGVARAVEEIRVTKGQVLGAGRDLLAHVGQDRGDGHDVEAAVVDRHDGAMAAEVQAAACGLDVAGEARNTVVHVAGVAIQAGQTGAGTGRLGRVRSGGARRPGRLRPGTVAGSAPAARAWARATMTLSASPATTELAGPARRYGALSPA